MGSFLGGGGRGLFLKKQSLWVGQILVKDVASFLRCLGCGILAKSFRSSYLYLCPHL